MSIKKELATAVILITIIMAILPKSPFQYFIDSVSGIEGLVNIAFLNWFIPFEQMIALGEAWLACISIYYSVEYAMRVGNMVS